LCIQRQTYYTFSETVEHLHTNITEATALTQIKKNKKTNEVNYL